MTPAIDESFSTAASFAFGLAAGSVGGYCLGKTTVAKQIEDSTAFFNTSSTEAVLSTSNQRLMDEAIGKCNLMLSSEACSPCAANLARMILNRILPDLKNSYIQVVRNEEVDLVEQRVGRSLESLMEDTLLSISDALDRAERTNDAIPKEAPFSQNVINIIKIEEFFNRT